MDDKPVWMSQLAKEYPEVGQKSLAEIAMPGTHDSGTYAIDGKSPLGPDCDKLVKSVSALFGKSVIQTHYAPWAKCQGYDILTQLLNGVRYLDLRVCYVDNELWLTHGQLSVLVSDVLEQIVQFVRDIGVDEILLLDFNHFYEMDRESHQVLCSMIMSALSKWICPGLEHSCHVTLAELWKTQQRILVFYSNPVEVAAHPWLWSHFTHVTTPWHNTPDNDVLLQRMSEQWQQWRDAAEFERRFTITQSQRTPTSSMITAGFMNHSSAGRPKSITDLAHGTHLLVCDWLEARRHFAEAENKWTGVNIVIADFIELHDGELVDAIIRINTPIAST